MSNGMPYAKWYASDWLGDPLLRMVSPYERGIWADLLNVMMASTPYGYLSRGGLPLPDADAARFCGVDLDAYREAMDRLEAVGIPSRTPDGIIYSRRLVRDHDAFVRSSAAGRKGGGNPALRNPPHSPPVSKKKPEAKRARTPNPPLYPPIKGGKQAVEIPETLAKQGGFAEAWDAWKQFRKALKAPVTPRIERSIIEKLQTRPTEAVKALDTAMESSWRGFEWAWIDNRNAKVPAGQGPRLTASQQQDMIEVDAEKREAELARRRKEAFGE